MLLSLLLSSTMSLAKLATAITDEVAEPSICAKVNLQHPNIIGDVEHSESRELCYSNDFVVALSKNCKTTCPLLEKVKTYTKPLAAKQMGTPASWLCKAVGGEPSMLFLVTTEAPEQKNKIHFCKLNDDLVSDNLMLRALPIPAANKSSK